MGTLKQDFKFNYSLTPEWRQPLVENLGASIEGNKMYFDNEIAVGSSCFLEMLSDVSVFIVNITLKKDLHLTRISSEDDFWVVYYDLSDNYNSHILDDLNFSTGYKSKLNFAIVDNQVNSTYKSKVGEQYYFLRIFIRKSFMKSLMADIEFEKDFKDIFDNKKREMVFYGHIDSRSKILLYNLKKQDVNNPNYEFLLKAAAHNLLGYLIERLSTKIPNTAINLEKDIDAIMQSQKYLRSNLLMTYPGIDFLANLANMSSTKYRNLYNNIFGMSPALFFRNEKLLLAKQLLESGDFKLISDVAYELGYTKTAYFSSIYRNYHGVLPHTVLKYQT